MSCYLLLVVTLHTWLTREPSDVPARTNCWSKVPKAPRGHGIAAQKRLAPSTQPVSPLMLLAKRIRGVRTMPSRSNSGRVRQSLSRSATMLSKPAATARGRAMCSTCSSRPTCSFVKNMAGIKATAFAPERSHHQRQLPDGLVAFSSREGRRRFAQSMEAGQAEAYFPLSEQFVTQSEVAYCGLASLTMCMNALRVDPQRIWKDAQGPGWRWWTDEMFPTECKRGSGLEPFHHRECPPVTGLRA